MNFSKIPPIFTYICTFGFGFGIRPKARCFSSFGFGFGLKWKTYFRSFTVICTQTYSWRYLTLTLIDSTAFFCYLDMPHYIWRFSANKTNPMVSGFIMRSFGCLIATEQAVVHSGTCDPNSFQGFKSNTEFWLFFFKCFHCAMKTFRMPLRKTLQEVVQGGIQIVYFAMICE